MSWHVAEPLWRAYAAGRLDPAAEAAVETHVTACAVCRAGARAFAPSPEPLWAAVQAEITRPRTPRFGIPQDDLVLLTGAGGLLLSWSVAVGAAVLCAVVTGLAPSHFVGGPDALFLILAPLVPVLAVVAAYDSTDPLREVTEAAPFSKLRLALLRATAALSAAVPLTVAVALSVPNLQNYVAAWLLPGLALTVATLILLTWLRAGAACAVTSAGWILATGAAAGSGTIGAVATALGQAGFAIALIVLTSLFVRTSLAQGVTR